MGQLARTTGSRQPNAQSDDNDHNQSVVAEPMCPETLRGPIIAALRRVHDPEIPVNVYDLGLIYRIDLSDNGDVVIDVT